MGGVMRGVSDSGTAPSSSAALGVMGPRTFQANCLWLMDRQSGALHLTPCADKRDKPSTVLYGDWFIRHSERIRNANFPASVELRAQRRADYPNHKTNYKCSQIGRWIRGVPTPHGDLECVLRGEDRLRRQKEDLPVGNISNRRHRATKSVKIEGCDPHPQHSGESSASESATPSRRVSTESASGAVKRVSTGADRAIAASDRPPVMDARRLIPPIFAFLAKF